MDGLRFISCLRFSIQLMMSEAFFVLAWKRKKYFPVRLAAAMAAYLLSSWLIFHVFANVPGNSPITYTAYYTSLFALSLGIMRFCFQTSGKDILFAGVCGYAAQHIGFSAATILVEVTGIELGPIGDFIFIRILPYLLIDIFI